MFLSGRMADSKQPPKRKPIPKQEKVAQIMRATNTSIPTTLEVQGSLVAFDKIDIFTEVSGTLEETAKPFKVGSYFPKGSILILNNNFLGMVRQWQQLFFDKRYSFTELTNPDFQLISKGYGIPPQKVEARGDLDAAIDQWLDTDGPQLLEVVVEKEENVFPMVPSGASVSDIRLE